mmetsp:Transcript_43283/g.114024  ORF Transcript_43283/g.114024 Transcript_43283/m.114024 type:complete len:179 (-) Transcript_43283:106-642(-)
MGNLLARLFSRVMNRYDARICMVGLDCAGKATILHKWKTGEVVDTVPTIGFHVETVQYRSSSFTVWDIGGQDKIRQLCKHYYADTGGLIFVVDSNDQDRMEEAAKELHLAMAEDELKNVPLLVLANKQDLRSASSKEEVTEKLRLDTLTDRQWYIQPTCATTGDGLYEGMAWLSRVLS